MFFLHVQDLVDAFIGPFDTVDAAEQHYQWTKQQGDAAVKISITSNIPPAGEFVLTPEEDKAFNRS